MSRQKQGYLYGTMVLAMGTVVVKLIGALFKIPLTNLLGGVGMSYFNVAYDLYYPLYALFISGVPVAVSKLVSECVAHGRGSDARRVLRIAVGSFSLIGVVGALLMYLGADWFATLVHNPDARFAVRMLSPTLLFGCIMAALRGYWQGLSEMRPTAVSQIIEAMGKLILGLTLAYGIAGAGLRQFAETGVVFGRPCPGPAEAQLAVLPFAAAGAILGVACSSGCGLLFMILHSLRARRKSIPWPQMPERMPPEQGLAGRLFAIAAPVCLASVITNLTSLIDLLSITGRLTSAAEGGQLFSLYAGRLPAGVGPERLASYLYGCYSGLAVPLYNLVPSLTATIGVSLLPAVAGAWAVRDRPAMSRNISSALRVSMLLAAPAGFGLMALAEPILQLIYYSKPFEAAAIAPALRLMGLGSIVVALTIPVNAVLQAVGRAALPVRLLLIGGLLKLLCNFLLVGTVQLNIQAAPVGTIVCYLVVLCCGLYAMLEQTGVEIHLYDTFGKPLLAGALCGAFALLAYELVPLPGPDRVQTIFAVAVGGIVYLFSVVLLRAVKKEDVLMVCKQEKLINILEKLRILG